MTPLKMLLPSSAAVAPNRSVVKGRKRPEADTRHFRSDTELGTECGLRLQDAGAEDA